jgi:oxygen-independent coproporphyrinogen-3 oxidase
LGDKSASAEKYYTYSADYGKEKTVKLACGAVVIAVCGEIMGYRPAWGMLTGVRPSKVATELLQVGISKTRVKKILTGEYFVIPKKAALATEVALNEQKLIGKPSPKDCSVYISIPFCPTRCSYCSFVSHSVEKAGRLIEDYVKLLCREIAITGRIAKENKLRLETIYIGGGTPTALEAYHLTEIMNAISKNFDMSNIKEYTVEAGRPDVTTKEKLIAIKNGGATRISINPQTMNNSVLEAIGRKHTAEQMVEVFKMAREIGFDNINPDLIAGLPTDTLESFSKTLDKAVELNPEKRRDSHEHTVSAEQ